MLTMPVVEWIRHVGLIVNVWIVLLEASLWVICAWTGYEEAVRENMERRRAHECRFLLPRTQYVY
jgi:hypothetical protein